MAAFSLMPGEFTHIRHYTHSHHLLADVITQTKLLIALRLLTQISFGAHDLDLRFANKRPIRHCQDMMRRKYSVHDVFVFAPFTEDTDLGNR